MNNAMTNTPPNPTIHNHHINHLNHQVILPATDIPLYGHHLIEASAGTGKTWTLSGIVLRLLIEGKRQPEQMICSTFTRAAAAELRERIYNRLLDFNHALEWLLQLSMRSTHQQALFGSVSDDESANKNSLSKDKTQTDDKSKKKTDKKENIKNYLIELANQSDIPKLQDRINDQVNLHLLTYLIEHHQTYPINQAIQRTRHLLTALDKLFVSTLDSLAQKWLSEFANETGHTSHIRISEDQDEHISIIIHNHIRQFYSDLYHNDKVTYQLLFENQSYQVSDFRQAVERGLNFLSVPIDENPQQTFDFEKYDQIIKQILQIGWTELEPYFDANYRKQQKMFANGKLGKNLPTMPQFFAVLSEHPYDFVKHLPKEAQDFWHGFQEYVMGEEDATGKVKGFNANSQTQRQAFDALNIIEQLKQLSVQQDALDTYLQDVRQQLMVSIVKQVREQLPKRLAEVGETTFSLQMQKLNHALLGKHGESLAKLIRHRYPIALIDESQDINGEQATVIQRVYLSGQSSHRHAFLLLVGDPKQAIYGFRGGDVANYNQIKTQTHFSNSTYSLAKNFRSTQGLVEALNHWFGQGQIPSSNRPLDNKLDNNSPLAHLGEGIYYQHIKAHREQGKLLLSNITKSTADTDAKADKKPTDTNPRTIPPVSIIHLPYKEGNDVIQTTAQHIAKLLQSSSQLDGRMVRPSDIAVLAKTHTDLDGVQQQLAKFGILANKSASSNIFESVMAQELLAILQALQNPYSQSHINRTLVSQSRAMTLEQVKRWQDNQHTNDKNSLSKYSYSKNTINQKTINYYEQYQQTLNNIAKSWQKKGTMAVLNEVLSLSICPYYLNSDRNSDSFNQQQLGKNVWQTLSQQENAERLLLDLRQLLDIIGEHTRKMGEFEIIDWLSTLIESPPNHDWATSLPIASSEGVKLMTIHGSKGLDFKIVYVLGMSASAKKSNDDFHLYAYVDDINHIDRRLSAMPHRHANKQDNKIAQIELKENFDELKRLFYVAMTRASEQLFIVIKDRYNTTDIQWRPLNHWLDCVGSKNYDLPVRLQPHIGWLDGDINDEELPITKPSKPLNQISQSDVGISTLQPQQIDYPDYHSVIKQTHFVGWGRTSFTALSRLLNQPDNHLNGIINHQDNASNLFNDDLLNDGQSLKQDNLDYQILNHQNMDYQTVMIMEQAPNIRPISQQSNKQDKPSLDNNISDNNIRFNFIKGANAGSFLHKVLEKLSTEKPNTDDSQSKLIDKYLLEYDLPKRYSSQWQSPLDINKNASNESIEQAHNRINNDTKTTNPSHQQLIMWLQSIMQTPFVASNICLNDLPAQQLKAEMSFNMGMQGKLDLTKLADTILQHLPNDPDKHLYFIDNLSTNQFELRYLKGEMDLVYEHHGKFYVVDYKSNYLGNQLNDYQPDALKVAMSKAGYWLQAMIYQVALHRLLKMRLKNYHGNEQRYLGAVEYVFLRGFGADFIDDNAHNINNTNNDNQAKMGSIHWEMPIGLIHALDKFL